jgi:CRISPR/Cas system CSM-associated protein Csm4 (group 5 of RAMP superfamily)
MSLDLNAEVERAKFLDWIENNKDKIMSYLLLEEEDTLMCIYTHQNLINDDEEIPKQEKLINKSLKFQLREIIKAQSSEEPPYITYNELKVRLNITADNEGDLDEDLKRLLEDGEIYEPKINWFRWLR